MVIDAALFSTQQYVRIKGKIEQSLERSSVPLFGVVAIEKGAFGSPSTKVANFTYTYIYLEWKKYYFKQS